AGVGADNPSRGPAAVLFPAPVSDRVPAVLVPGKSIAESSLIDTLPGALNVSVPKFVVSLASSPTTTEPAVKDAAPLTVRLVPLASVTAPATLMVSAVRVVVPWKATLSVPAWPTMVRLVVKSGSAPTVSDPLSPPMLTVKPALGFANAVVANVPAWLRICEIALDTPSSSRNGRSAVPGRLKVRLAIVLPLMSTGATPV